MPDRAKAEEQIRTECLVQCANKSPEEYEKVLDSRLRKSFPLLNDFDACYETFRILNEYDRGHMVKAVMDVYMYDAQRELRSGEISRRVVRVAITNNVSEVQVYRWLRQVRDLFSALRGLRTEDDND